MTTGAPDHRTEPLWAALDRRNEFDRPDLPMLTVVSEEGVRARDLADGRAPSEDLSGYRVVHPGDLVVNKMWARFGAYGVAQQSGIISPAYWILTPRTGHVEPRFLHHLLRSAPYRAEIWRRSKDLPPNGFDIPWDQFRTISIPLPHLRRQRAIAAYLDRETARIDDLIAAKRRMVELVEDRWQVVMHKAVEGSLTPNRVAQRATSVPWLTDVPSNWREGHLKLVAKLGTGHTPSRSHPEWWVNLTIPWITTGEVAQMRSDRIEYITETREHISELGMSNSSAMLHPAGTVVLCRTASAGYSAIMARDMATSQDFATWTCGPLLRPRFLLLCLRAMRQDLLGRLAMGSTHKTIYMPDIEAIKVPIPPLNEQDALVAAAYSEQRALDQCATRLGTQVELLQERRQALITAAVTGQLDIPEAA